MDVRDKILRAAVTVFAEVGFRGATTRRIAQEAGVNEITLFRHFGSKDRLLHEAISRSDLAPPCTSELPAPPRRPRAELLAWAREHTAHLTQRRSLLCTCLAEMSEHPEIIPETSPSTHAVNQLRGYLKALKSAGFTTTPFDPDIVAPMFLGVLFADTLGRHFQADLFTKGQEKSLEGYVDFFLRGMGVEKNAGNLRAS